MSTALLHGSTSISASLPQIKPSKKRPFCRPVFFSMHRNTEKHTSTSVTGGEAGRRRRRSGAYLKNAQSAAGLLLGSGSLVGSGPDVSTGGRRNARRLHRQPGEADIRRTLGALQLSVFLSLSFSVSLSSQTMLRSAGALPLPRANAHRSLTNRT